ncbi:MAG: hypothetical protein ACE5GW_05200 [Planctomycetota bacterium]
MSASRFACACALFLSFCLLLPASLRGQGFTLAVVDTEVDQGESFVMPVEGEWPENVAGFSLSISFTPNPPIEAMAIAVENTLVGALQPDFLEATIDLAAGELIYAVLFEVLPPYDDTILPPLGFPIAIAEITGDIPPDTPEQDIPFTFVDGLGSPPINNIYVVDFESIPVDTTTPGILFLRHSPVPPPMLFIRGDANSDAEVDISDVVFLLLYSFSGGEAPLCLDASDANDDGFADISDAVYLLFYFFLAGPAPWPPFPLPGIDFSADDGLGCEVSIF